MLKKEVFGEIWKMFNEVRKNNTDAGWEKCVADAERIAKENPEKAYKKIILAVVKEADEFLKIENAKERSKRYRETAKAFNEAWALHVSLSKVFDVNAVHAYCKENPGKMAKSLSAAIYEVACESNTVKGAFMKDAFKFYKEFKGKGFSDAAFAKAEELVKKYPECTLQVMSMCDDLRERKEAC